MTDSVSERVGVGVKALEKLADHPLKFMEVCGTHTVSIYRSGLRALLPGGVQLVSGPGCPVCVTSQGSIDTLVRLSGKEGLAIAKKNAKKVPFRLGQTELNTGLLGEQKSGPAYIREGRVRREIKRSLKDRHSRPL